jgi:hypothetical protein
MINPKTGALVFAMLSLGGMVAIPGLSLIPTTQTAFAQGVVGGDELANGIIDDILGADDEEEADTSQTVDQPVTQDTNQAVDQSETNDQHNDNTQTQAGAIDQDIAQGIVDGDDSAKSKSESGDAKKYSTSSSSAGDAVNVNDQAAENNADLTQDQSQAVDQDNTATFGDDNADLDNVNLAVPIAVPINVDENQEEVAVEEPEPPVDGEEDTIEICTDQGIEEVTLDELQDIIDSGEFLGFPENGLCRILIPLNDL